MLWSRQKTQKPEFLIIGLGNPGSQYAATRHNTGWWVLDELTRSGSVLQKLHRHQGHAEYMKLSGVQTALIKPTTFYNRSGQCLKAWLSEFPGARFVVVHDDVALKPGKIRLKQDGRSGGNNGVQSIIDSLGTESFTRLKIGVGGPESGEDMSDHVLSPPEGPERRLIESAVLTAAQMLRRLAEDDMQGALDLLTRRGEDNADA